MSYGVDNIVTTVRNPQGNSIIEQVYQTISISLRISTQKKVTLWIANLQNIAFGIRAEHHQILRMSLAQAIFGCNMIMPRARYFDLEVHLKRKFKQMLEDNQCENRQYTTMEYDCGDLVMLKNDTGELPKRSPWFLGLFETIETQNTGNIVIRRDTNLSETVNIWWLKPYQRRGRNAV